MKAAKMEGDLPLIWQYLEEKIVPFINKLFSEVNDSSSSTLPGHRVQQSVLDIFDFKRPL